jgi:hypothetical protein
VPSNGFNGAVTLLPSGWPAGITGTFSTNPVTTSSQITLNVASGVAPGAYSLVVTGTSGTLSANTTIPLTVMFSTVTPNFTMTAAAATVNPGSAATSTVTIIPTGGFNSTVALSPSNWPTGITATFATNPATTSSLVTINIAATVATGSYLLAVTGTSGIVAQTTTIALTVTAPLNTGSTATFTGLDTSSQGTWTGKYGSDGFLIANDTQNLPAYANVSFNGALTYTWAGLTSDLRALQSYQGSTARIASCYYATNGSFTISLDLTDGAAHQVALYLLDWDTTSRTDTITITDHSTGATLDSRSVSGFYNGTFVVWNIKGIVDIKVSAAAGQPVASAIFFAPAGTVSTPSPGFTLTSTPATANSGSTGTSTVSVTPANGFNSPVTLAASGWPPGITGSFSINPATGSSLVTINVASNVTPGSYSLPVTGVSGSISATTSIALVVTASGVGTSATFAGLDTTTQGAWPGKYGSAGYLIANASNPALSTVGVSGALAYTWAGQTTDARALQSSAGASTGIASAYTTSYIGQSFTINVGTPGGTVQKISLYLLDWDSTARNQTITILEAATNNIPRY